MWNHTSKATVFWSAYLSDKLYSTILSICKRRTLKLTIMFEQIKEIIIRNWKKIRILWLNYCLIYDYLYENALFGTKKKTFDVIASISQNKTGSYFIISRQRIQACFTFYNLLWLMFWQGEFKRQRAKKVLA